MASISSARAPSSTSDSKYNESVEEHDPRPPWRPTSLKPLPLVLVTILTAALWFSLEILRERSKQHKGLYFMEDPERNPAFISFVTNIVPTAIAVFYANIWQVLDLDVKRTEPYFQLASSEQPLQILFLDYAFEYVLLVPFKAIRNKHRMVALVSTMNIIISFILLPLCNSIISTVPVNLDDEITVRQFTRMSSVSRDMVWKYKGDDLVSLVRSIRSFNASLPDFATYQYGIPYFEIPDAAQLSSTEIWTLNSYVYKANPSCSIVPQFPASFGESYSFRDESYKGSYREVLISNITGLQMQDLSNITDPGPEKCSANISMYAPLIDGNHIAQNGHSDLYWAMVGDIGGEINERQRYPLLSTKSGPGCSLKPIFATLVQGSRLESTTASPTCSNCSRNYVENNASAIAALCSISYVRQNARIKFAVLNATVLSVEEDRNAKPHFLLRDNFDSMPFEDSLFGLGKGSLTYGVNYGSNESIMSTIPVITEDNLATIAFRALQDPSSMNDSDWVTALETTIQLSFAASVQNFINRNLTSTFVTVERRRSSFALQISPPIAVLLEVILSAAVLTSVLMVFIYMKRRINIRSDPDSITSMCSLIACSFRRQGPLFDENSRLDNCSTDNLLQILPPKIEKASKSDSVTKKNRLRCLLRCKYKFILLSLARLCLAGCNPRPVMASYNRDRLSFLFHRQPVMLSLAVLSVIIFFTFILLILGIFCNGYSFLATSSPVLGQLVWSFMPGLLATLMASFWITVHRDLSILEPWARLSQGHVSARLSISLRYSAWTPYTALVDSLWFRHWIIVIVSIAWLATNVLNISMGGLFTVAYRNVPSNVQLSSELAPSALPSKWNMTSGSVTEAFHLFRSNITEDTPLPPWTSSKYSFVPVSLTSQSAESNSSYQVKTTGIGASLICETYKANMSTSTNVYDHAWNFTVPSTPELPSAECTVWNSGEWIPRKPMLQSIMLWAPQSFDEIAPFVPTPESGQEYHVLNELGSSGTDLAKPELANITVGDNSDCRSRAFIVMARFMNQTNYYKNNKISFSRRGLLCQPTIITGEFDLTVRDTGEVQSYRPKVLRSGAQLFENLQPFLASYHLLFMNATDRSRDSGDTHMPFDWPSLLLTRLHWTQSPNTNLKDHKVLENYARQVYERVFSIWFSIYKEEFLTRLHSPSTIAGRKLTLELRWVPSVPLFVITIIILVAYIPMVIVVHRKKKDSFPGARMPKSIGAIIPWVAHSRMLEDFKGTNHMTDRQIDGYLAGLDRKYSFGWFIGTDGKRRLGLEMEPYVNCISDSLSMVSSELASKNKPSEKDGDKDCSQGAERSADVTTVSSSDVSLSSGRSRAGSTVSSISSLHKR